MSDKKKIESKDVNRYINDYIEYNKKNKREMDEMDELYYSKIKTYYNNMDLYAKETLTNVKFEKNEPSLSDLDKIKKALNKIQKRVILKAEISSTFKTLTEDYIASKLSSIIEILNKELDEKSIYECKNIITDLECLLDLKATFPEMLPKNKTR